MGTVVELSTWIARRAGGLGAGPAARRPTGAAPGARGAGHGSGPTGPGTGGHRAAYDPGSAGHGTERLERAVARLDAVARAGVGDRGELPAWVETELLAIIGAITMDLLDEAGTRADRLAARLDRRRVMGR